MPCSRSRREQGSDPLVTEFAYCTQTFLALEEMVVICLGPTAYELASLTVSYNERSGFQAELLLYNQNRCWGHTSTILNATAGRRCDGFIFEPQEK